MVRVDATPDHGASRVQRSASDAGWGRAGEHNAPMQPLVAPMLQTGKTGRIGINVYLSDERGKPISDVGEPLVLPAIALPPLDDPTSMILRYIDPYGNTMFNAAQAAVCRDELRRAATHVDDDGSRQGIAQVANLADQCANEVHLYLWFIGD